MNSNILLSIVIPMYNCAAYLEQCIDSIVILNSPNNLEIILIDDNSSDSTLVIAKKYCGQYSFIKLLINETNIGPNLSRWRGIENASASYVFFLDGDDTLFENCLDRLILKLVKCRHDVIVFNSYRVSVEFVLKNICELINREYDTDDKLVSQNYFLGTLGNKVFKKSILVGSPLCSIPLRHSEDLLMSTNLLLTAKSILFLPLNIYKYHTRDNSIIQSRDGNRFIHERIAVVKALNLLNFHNDFNLLNKKINSWLRKQTLFDLIILKKNVQSANSDYDVLLNYLFQSSSLIMKLNKALFLRSEIRVFLYLNMFLNLSFLDFVRYLYYLEFKSNK